MDDVVAAVVGMAGVKADTELVIICDAVVDAGKLLESTSGFRPFSRHSLKGDVQACVFCEHFI